MNPHYPLVSRRAQHRCEYCHAPEAVFNFPFEVEHVLPSSRQGLDIESNLALSCRVCNLRKSDLVQARDPETETVVPLFNPREHRWESPFRVDADACVIQGLTPAGRATVDCLDLNSPTQLEARRQWMRLGLFP